MPEASMRAWLLPAFTVLVSGCAAGGGFVTPEASRPDAPAVELTATPFFPQSEDLCGPAALATVLNHSGVDVSFEELRPAIYLPERRGSLQIELVAAIRSYGRVPYRIDPSLAALMAELQAGRPVLVLQNLGVSIAPLWHYAVVVGYSPADRQVVLRSGDTRRHIVPEARFMRSWRRGEYWGVAALRPGELPGIADENRYLKAVAAVESVGRHDVALEAYQAALARWPGSTLARLGLGNAYYALGNTVEAERAYRDLLSREPDHPIALNNLAQTLVDQGCAIEAAGVIDAALDGPAVSEPLLASLVGTKAAVAAAPPRACRR